MKVLLVSERSGGHVYPALAAGQALAGKKPEKEKIFFFVTSEFFKLNIKNKGFTVVGKSFKKRNLAVESIWRFFEALYIIFRIRPEKTIGFGGRDSFFLILFSRFFGIDTRIYEPNAQMGRANKLLSFFIAGVFRGITPRRQAENQKVVGVPLGKDILKIDKAAARKKLNLGQSPVVLCFGGSQGSGFINDIFFKFAARHKGGTYQIIHLTGSRDYSRASDIYGNIKNNKLVYDFYWDMSVLYSAADIAVCRAGALSLAGISFYNLPAILIPHPAGGGHQFHNASYLGRKGAALVFEQEHFCYKDFDACLQRLIQNQAYRGSIKENLKKIKIAVSNETFSYSLIS